MVEPTPKEPTTKDMALQDAAASLDQNQTVTQDQNKRLAATTADEQAMLEQKKKEKSALSQALKAAKAEKLTKKDAVPSPVVTLNNGTLELASIHSQEAFIYQGSVGCAHNKQELDQAGITHILTCAAGLEQKFPDDYKYETLNLLDTGEQNIGMFFQKAHGFINQCKEENGRVLIHCFAGKSRASTVTISYLMKEMKLDLKTSLDHLKKQRPIAEPNVGFLIQLRHYEKDIFGTNSDVPITNEQIEKEKSQLRRKGTPQQISEAEFMKGLKTTEQLEAEGAVEASDQKQLSDADELITEPKPIDIKKYLVDFLKDVKDAQSNEEKIKDLIEKLFKFVKKDSADSVIRQKFANTLVLMVMQSLRNCGVVVRDLSIGYKLKIKYATEQVISEELTGKAKEEFNSKFDKYEFSDLVYKFVEPKGLLQTLTNTLEEESKKEEYHKKVKPEQEEQKVELPQVEETKTEDPRNQWPEWKKIGYNAFIATKRGCALDLHLAEMMDELSDDDFSEIMSNEEVLDYFNDPYPEKAVLQPKTRADVKNNIINWTYKFKQGFVELFTE